MFKIFDHIKSTAINTTILILNITILFYLVSIFGFSHINKELLINTFTGLSAVLIILVLSILTISFIFYASFKLAYKKILSNFDKFSNIINDKENK